MIMAYRSWKIEMQYFRLLEYLILSYSELFFKHYEYGLLSLV